jgi:HD-like signal output (HDOD) protein
LEYLTTRTMFGRLFGKKGRAADEIPPLSAGVRDAILSVAGGRGIPAMPSSAHRAFQISTNPRAEAADFVSLIESDEGLSGRVLKIANSVFFDRGTPSHTVEQAVLVIGMNELRSLLTSNSLVEMFPSPSPMRKTLWHHDIGVALASRTLARRLLPSRADFAFISGLMHDIGKLFLLQRAPLDYEKIVDEVARTGCSFAEAEQEAFPFDHTQVGQLIGERWNFPPDLLRVVRDHHLPWDALSGPLSLVHVIKGADLVVHSLGIGDPPKHSRLRTRCDEELPIVWERLSVGATGGRELLAECRKTIEMEQDLYLSGRH